MFELFIKSLPKSCSKKNLDDYFSTIVTDFKLKKSKNKGKKILRYAFLWVNSELDYDKILNSEHIINGEKLNIQSNLKYKENLSKRKSQKIGLNNKKINLNNTRIQNLVEKQCQNPVISKINFKKDENMNHFLKKRISTQVILNENKPALNKRISRLQIIIKDLPFSTNSFNESNIRYNLPKAKCATEKLFITSLNYKHLVQSLKEWNFDSSLI